MAVDIITGATGSKNIVPDLKISELNFKFVSKKRGKKSKKRGK